MNQHRLFIHRQIQYPLIAVFFSGRSKYFFYARVYARSAGLSDKPRRYAIAYRARHVEKLSRAKVLRCKCPIFMRARYADTQLQRFVGQILSTQINRGRAGKLQGIRLTYFSISLKSGLRNEDFENASKNAERQRNRDAHVVSQSGI